MKNKNEEFLCKSNAKKPLHLLRRSQKSWAQHIIFRLSECYDACIRSALPLATEGTQECRA